MIEKIKTRDIIEKLAKIIYDKAIGFDRKVPDWVENGNSFAQVEARRTAIKILEELEPEFNNLVMEEVSDDAFNAIVRHEAQL